MTVTHHPSEASTADWSSTMNRVVDRTVLVGPALMVLASLLVAADVGRLPGDLDWISEPEGTIGVYAAVFFVPMWIAIGRRISTAAPRTGVWVTLLGVAGAVGWVYPFGYRLYASDLVDAGFDANALNEVSESGGTLFSALVLPVMFLGLIVPLVAGIAILRTKAAPAWAGAALLLFPLVFVTAQAAYVAIEVTYPLACLSLLAGAFGATRDNSAPR